MTEASPSGLPVAKLATGSLKNNSKFFQDGHF